MTVNRCKVSHVYFFRLNENLKSFLNTCHFDDMLDNHSNQFTKTNDQQINKKITIVRHQCPRFFGTMLLPKLKSLFGFSRRDRVDTGTRLLEQVLADNKRLFITEDIEQLKIAFKYESQLVTETEELETSYPNHM